MVELETPATKISLKKPCAWLKDGFTVTYEYSWQDYARRTSRVESVRVRSVS